MSLRAVVLFCLFLFWDQVFQPVLGSEPFAEKGQKNYERDEEGKIIPHRQVNFLSFLKSEALKSEMLRDSFKTSVQFPCFFMLWNLSFVLTGRFWQRWKLWWFVSSQCCSSSLWSACVSTFTFMAARKPPGLNGEAKTTYKSKCSEKEKLEKFGTLMAKVKMDTLSEFKRKAKI